MEILNFARFYHLYSRLLFSLYKNLEFRRFLPPLSYPYSLIIIIIFIPPLIIVIVCFAVEKQKENKNDKSKTKAIRGMQFPVETHYLKCAIDDRPTEVFYCCFYFDLFTQFPFVCVFPFCSLFLFFSFFTWFTFALIENK